MKRPAHSRRPIKALHRCAGGPAAGTGAARLLAWHINRDPRSTCCVACAALILCVVTERDQLGLLRQGRNLHGQTASLLQACTLSVNEPSCL